MALPARRVRGWTAVACLGLVTALGACSDAGGGAAASDDPSLEEFCETFDGLFERVLSEDVAGDRAATVRALQDWAKDLEEVGTPGDIPEDVRHGFELFVEQAQAIEEDASLADLERLVEDPSAADHADGDAFSDWVQDSCPLDVPALPGSEELDDLRGLAGLAHHGAAGRRPVEHAALEVDGLVAVLL